MKRSMLFEGVVVTLLILLSFTVIVMVLGGSSTESGTTAIGYPDYMYTGNDNTLYIFNDNTIQAIDKSGKPLWSFDVPAQWMICWGMNSPELRNGILKGETGLGPHDPVIYSDGGPLYVYLQPNDTPFGNSVDTPSVNEKVIAISSTGKLLWSVPFESRKNLLPDMYKHAFGYTNDIEASNAVWFEDVSIYASKGRVYVFHEYNETVLDANGRVLWNVENVADPASVDENGFVYLAQAQNATDEPITQYLEDFRVPGNVVSAYYPNGTLYWRNYAGEPVPRQYVRDDEGDHFDSLPLYDNGTIYVPLSNGIIAYDTTGKELWTKRFDPSDFKFELPSGYKYVIGPNGPENDQGGDFRMFGKMPFDSEGNIYMQYSSHFSIAKPYNVGQKMTYLIAISPNGSDLSRRIYDGDKIQAVSEGVGYTTNTYDSRGVAWDTYHYEEPRNISDLTRETITALDLKSGRELWAYTLPINVSEIAVVNESNMDKVLLPAMAGEVTIYNSNHDPNFLDYNLYNGKQNVTVYDIKTNLYPGRDRIYVSFSSVNVEYPVIFNESKCAYARGIYALDRNGTLLWYEPTGSFVDSMVVGNGTVFYRSDDGKLVSVGAGAAAGATLTAIAYIIIRFLCLGAVARAKARLNKNEKRNQVYAFIAGNPGSTIYEISRGMRVSLGTVRYHVFILGMNHKVVQSRMDGKYIRYFTNSNSYSKDEQLILSFMRRDAMGNMLRLLQQKPGISNAEIASSLGMQESVVSRCIKELIEKGVVTREQAGTRNAYYIEGSHREHVASVLGLLKQG